MAVTITTTGATFSPVIALTGGSGATVTWSCTGFTSQTGLTPSFSFGSATTRTVTMTVTGGGGYADVTLFNLGYDNTIDTGTYMPSSGFAKAAELVSGVSGVSQMTGLVYFLADSTALAGSIDFSGMSALQFIQCYNTNIAGVTLTGCTALKRLQVEACKLTALDLNPVAGNLYDLRAAVQRGGGLTFTTLTSPMAVLYHYCIHSQTVANSIPLSRLPAVNQYWTWSDGLSGAIAPSSSALNWVDSNGNAYTSADFTGQFTSANGQLYLRDSALTSVTLTGCTGLTTIDLYHNKLPQAAVDSVLATVASWGTSGGTLNLSRNAAPSDTGTGYVTTLTGRGWTVSVGEGISVAISVVQSPASGGSFPVSFGSPVTAGNTVFIIAGAYTTSSGAISSSAPTLGGSPVTGAVALFAPGGSKGIASAFNGGGHGAYVTIWMLPNCPGGSSSVGLTVTGAGGVTGAYAVEVSGLGPAPVLDKSSSGSGATGSAVDSGSSGAITVAPEFILAATQIFAGADNGSAPWTASNPGGSTATGAGYQVVTSAGGSYDWTQTAYGSGDPWAAGVVALYGVTAEYATQAFSTTLNGVNRFVEAGAKYDSAADASLIAVWPSNFTTTAPAAGTGNVTGVLAGYLTVYPNGPQV